MDEKGEHVSWAFPVQPFLPVSHKMQSPLPAVLLAEVLDLK
jgi:hypothetical protein